MSHILYYQDDPNNSDRLDNSTKGTASKSSESRHQTRTQTLRQTNRSNNRICSRQLFSAPFRDLSATIHIIMKSQ